MNIIDREFHQLTGELRRLSEKEIYHRMRNAFDLIPASTKRSCADFFASYNYWGKLDADNDIYEEIEMKAETLHDHTDDFIWLYGRLADFRSKKTLYAILNNWYRYDLTSTTQAREYMFDDYFDWISSSAVKMKSSPTWAHSPVTLSSHISIIMVTITGKSTAMRSRPTSLRC